MKKHISYEYIVAEDTIIAYMGKKAIVQLKDKIGECEIRRLGKGSFSENTKIIQIQLPDSVERIEDVAFLRDINLANVVFSGKLKSVGQNAFGACTKLQQFCVIQKELSKDEYENLKMNSLKSKDNIYVARSMPNEILPKGLLASLEYKPIAHIQDGISALFSYTDKEDITRINEEHRLNERKSYISFSNTEENLTEGEVFQKHMQENYEEPYSEKSDSKSDWCVRVSESPDKYIKKTLRFVMDDNCTYVSDNKYVIVYRIDVGYFFWQSAQKVRMNNKDYYVYRRHYLTSDSEIEYIRKDMAIYCDGQLVKDREEREAVYGKYKLLSIL